MITFWKELFIRFTVRVFRYQFVCVLLSLLVSGGGGVGLRDLIVLVPVLLTFIASYAI